MSILTLLGWVLLGVLALLGLLLLFGLFWLWREFRRDHEHHLCNHFEIASPGRFKLRSLSTARAPTSARTEALNSIGTESIGAMKLSTAIGSLATHLMLHDDERVLVVYVTAPGHGEWLMTHRRRADGRFDTWINAYDRFHAAWAPGHEVIHWPGMDDAQLIEAAGAPDTSDLRFPTDLDELRNLYALELTRSWADRYRYGPGDFSWSDLLPHQPDESADAEKLQAQLAEAAPQKLAELAATTFIYSSDLSVAQWARHRDRLLFVHDAMTVADLKRCSNWTDFTHVTDALSKQLESMEPGIKAASAVEQANRSLPETERYQQLAHFDSPLPGVVFAAPEPEPETCDTEDLDDFDGLGDEEGSFAEPA